jgi:hypothetical protein
MPVRVTVTGPNPYKRLEEKRFRASGIMRQLAHGSARALSQSVPDPGGFLSRVIGQVENPSPDRYGVGSIRLLGDPDKKAPKNTIKNFLKWYRSQSGRKYYPRKRPHKIRFNQKFAWHYLDQRQKEQLSLIRYAANRFGGSGQPRYWPQLEAGMAEVGIHARDFLIREQTRMEGEFRAAMESLVSA